MSADAGRHVAELFAVPLNEFVRTRNVKAAQLKAAGHAEAAQAVQRLSRPTVPLWAVNQLARLVPKQVSRFIDLVQEARRKQLTDPRAAETIQAQRTELTALANRAADAVTKAGYRSSPSALRRISDTVLGAAVDRRLSEDLRHGRLTAELPAPGFEVLAGAIARSELRVLRGGRAQQRESELAAARQAREEAERARLAQEAETSKRDAVRRAEAAERAEREVHDLERQLAEARRRRREAQREAGAAARRARPPSER